MSSFFKEEESGPTTFQYNAVETVTGEKGFRVKSKQICNGRILMLSFLGTRNFKACSLKYYLLLINIEMLRVKHYIKAQHFFKNDTCF